MNVTLVALDDRLCDGQAETGPNSLLPTGGAPVESIEQPVELCLWNAGTLVRHAQ
jgi:hypothetical protein